MLLLRGPHVARYTWFGFTGGFEMRKRHLPPAQEAEVASEGRGTDDSIEEKAREKNAGEGAARPQSVDEKGSIKQAERTSSTVHVV